MHLKRPKLPAATAEFSMRLEARGLRSEAWGLRLEA
jgi:hypothetical protein